MMAALLDSVLRGQAAQMNLSSRLLANRRDLELMARYRLDNRGEIPDLPVLKGWRRESVGARLLKVLQGELAVVIEEDAREGAQLGLRNVESADD